MKWYHFLIIVIIGIMCYNVGHHTMDSQEVKRDTVKVCDTIRSVHDTTIYRDVPYETTIVKWDTITKDTVLPIAHKTYKDTLFNKHDTLYMESHVTGINVQRDSLKVDWRKSDVISKEYIYIREKEKKSFKDRFSIGPAVVVGYDPFNKNFGMTIGLGVSFDLW